MAQVQRNLPKLGFELSTPESITFKRPEGDNLKEAAAGFWTTISSDIGYYKFVIDTFAWHKMNERNGAPEGASQEPVTLEDMNFAARNIPEFKQRGRRDKDDTEDSRPELDKQHSEKSKLAGIVSVDHVSDCVASTSLSLEFFREEVGHWGKAMNMRNSTDTPTVFAAAGAPFIAGASGTVSLSCLVMSEKPADGFDGFDVQKSVLDEFGYSKEDLVVVLISLVIAQGHHSLSEGIIAAQAFGYFPNLVKPIENRDAYLAARNHFIDMELGFKSNPQYPDEYER